MPAGPPAAEAEAGGAGAPEAVQGRAVPPNEPDDDDEQAEEEGADTASVAACGNGIGAVEGPVAGSIFVPAQWALWLLGLPPPARVVCGGLRGADTEEKVGRSLACLLPHVVWRLLSGPRL
jgi:hypothetical protein